MSTSGNRTPSSAPGTPHPVHDRYAFVGLGNMGLPMALNLARFLSQNEMPPLVVYNRSKSRVEAFKTQADGENIAYKVEEDLQEIGRSCDVILTSLGSDDAVIQVYTALFAGQESQPNKGDGILPGGRGRSTIYLDTSTVYPTTTGQLERLASTHHSRHFLACPVFGPPPLAKTAGLIIVLAGNSHAKKHVAGVLVPAMGRKIMDMGNDVEKASKFKLIGNSMILGTIELLSESMTLADKSGVGADKLYEYIQEFFPTPSFLGYGKKIMESNFDGTEGFRLQGGIKDASLIRKLGEDSGVPLPIVDVAHQHLISARANGGDQLDWSSLVGGVRISAGMKPFEKKPSHLQRYD